MDEYEKVVDEFISKYGIYAFLDSIKLSLYKTGHKVIEESSLSDLERETADWLTNNVEKYSYLYKTGHKVIEESSLSEIERETADWLANNMENKLKDFFLADLSWANNPEERQKAFVDFFTKRMGKRVLEILPDDIKNYVLAHSI